jgi:hypothetical protein
MPARHRRYGGSYGRRRRRNRRVIAVVLLVGLGGAAAWYLRKDDARVPSRVTAQPSCTPAPSAAPTKPPVTVALPPPTAVTLSVLNGTNRALLAKAVGDQLAAQGFHVTGQGNNRVAVNGASQVVFGPGASLLARTTSAWVPGSTLVPAPRAKARSVTLVLGSSFSRLATPAEAAAAQSLTQRPATAAVTPSATPTVLPCRT